MLNKMKNLLKEEQGQGMTEYGLLLAAVVAVVVILVGTLSGALNTLIGKVKNTLDNAIS